MTTAEVFLWDMKIAAVSWDNQKGLGNFEYDQDFVGSGIAIAPIVMPLASQIYSFPGLSRETFRGLPGLLADSLPDDFGNALINTWLAKEGRSAESFNPVERLCYVGKRGMGALEYKPSIGPPNRKSKRINIEALVELASEILTKRNALLGSFAAPDRERALQDILRVGTSAGGARAKAIIAWNPKTNEVRSGQVDAGEGFSYWLLKFDGVSGNRDKELDDPIGFGLIEYAYHKMALEAGIEMSECRLLEENGRSHFMTRRFDRPSSDEKLHMQSLGAMAHYDYKQQGAYSYEQALQIMRKLEMPMKSIEEQFRRLAFNIVGRNQDDHVKNIGFLMDQSGLWSLSPAFDVTYSYNPAGDWTSLHQMSLNGKRDGFELEDFISCAKTASMKRGRAVTILEEVQRAVSKWKQFAQEAGVSEKAADQIAKTHRTHILNDT
jgi:serine/threonine-protein kinase HipA